MFRFDDLGLTRYFIYGYGTMLGWWLWPWWGGIFWVAPLIITVVRWILFKLGRTSRRFEEVYRFLCHRMGDPLLMIPYLLGSGLFHLLQSSLSFFEISPILLIMIVCIIADQCPICNHH